MLPVPSTQRRRSVRIAVGLLGWASRVAVALVFVLGVLATASATRVESETDVLVQGSEDRETVETVNTHATTSRRPCAAMGASARDIKDPGAPRALNPRRPAPPQRSWLRPRRTGPPDDDDDASLA